MNVTMIAILVSGLLFVAMLLFIDLGFWIGRRRRQRRSGGDEGCGSVDAAVFALLGLILAFSFSGAANRLEVRRDQIVQEANAIGTAYLRVDLLPPSEQPAVRALFRQYLDSRIAVYEEVNRTHDYNEAKAALDQGGEIQHKIWERSVTACQADAKPDICQLILPAISDMFDINTTRTMAFFVHAPLVMLVVLIALSLLAALVAGIAMSAQPYRSLLHAILFALAISISIYAVLDMEYPRFGLNNLKSMDRSIIQLREMIK